MFSPLSRGYGTWSGELYDPYKGDIDTESLPCIEPGETTHRHGVTVGLGPRASTTMSMRSGKDQPLTCTLTPRSDGKLNIPKTFTTRKGALILFSSQEDGDNGSASTTISRSSSRQKSALSKKFSAIETCSALGTLDRLSLSVLQYGDREEYDRENVSIADEKNKMVLNFIHSLDEREMDSRVRPGSELSSYLRDLKYRSSGRHGATYLPRSRETMELRALLQGLQENKWPMSYSSTDGVPPATERSNTYAEQFTRPSSRGSTRPASPASGTTTPRSILSARKLTASLKSLNPYRQPSIVDDSQLDEEQSTSTHPTISAKVTRKSPLQDDPVRSGSASPQRSLSQRLGPTSITGSIEEEPSDCNQGWRGSSVGTCLTDNLSEAPGITIPSNLDEGEESPKELGDDPSLTEQGDQQLEAVEGDGHGGGGLDNLSEGSDGSDVEMLYTAGNGRVDGSVDVVDGDGIVSTSVVSPSPNMQHDKSTQFQQHDKSSPSPHTEQSLSCDLPVVVDHNSPLKHPQLSKDNNLSSQVTEPGVDRLSVADDGGDVASSFTGVSEDTTEPVTIKVDINTLITGPIAEEDQGMAEFSGSEVKSYQDMDRNNVNLDGENSQLVKAPTGSELNDATGEKGVASDIKSQDGSMSRVSPSLKRSSSGGKSSPTAATTPSKAGSRQSSAKRVLSGRKSPRREATPVKQLSRQSSAKNTADRSKHETEVTETLVGMEVKTEAVDLEDVASVASSVLVEQDIVLPTQEETGEVSNGETASVPVDGAAQPLLPQYTGSVTSGEVLIIHDSVPPAPVASPRSSRPVSRTSSRPASYKTGQLPLAEEPSVTSPKSAGPPEQKVEKVQDKKVDLKEQKKEQKDERKLPDTASLSVGKKEETTPRAPEVGKKGQQRRGHLPRGKKAKKDVTKAIDISSVQPDEEEKPKEHEITVYKTVKVEAPKEESIIPDFITEEAARREDVSKEALEQQMVEMSKIVDNTMSGTVLEEDQGGLTDMELELAQKKIKERMAEAKEKMEQVDKPQPPKEAKPVKATTGKKGGKKNIEKKVVDTEKEKLKEIRRLEKEKRLEEAKALQSKIDKQQALRKEKEKEARDRGKELELEMERLEREAEEIQQAEDEVRQALAESRKKQREEREMRRRADLERKKQLAVERRDKEKKIMEKAKNKELEMLEKIEDANVRKRQREEEELKEEEEERLAQERLEEEMREAERLAEEEEEKLRELERQAEEEAMQRLIDEREEATRKKRQIEEQKRLVEEEEDRKRQIIIEEEKRLEAERLKREEEEDRKLQEEKRRLAELQRIESEAREQMQKELAHRREMALARRERNLESRSNMTRLKHAQGLTKPWVWSYFIQWPMETYNIPIGGEPDDKKKKRPKPKAKR